MDHIPQPHDCSFTPLRIPCLASDLYDEGSWRTYPHRHGWQVDYVRGITTILLAGEKRPTSENAAFLQSWFYFGLLKEVLGDLFVASQFVTEGQDGKRRISTKKLETVLGTWTSSYVAKFDAANVQEHLSKVYGLLIEHRSEALTLHNCSFDLGHPYLMLSFAVLSERLAAAVIDIYAHFRLETPVEQTWRLRTEDFSDIGQPILGLMQERGWCPYDLKRLSTQIKEVSTLYYYSNLKAPRSAKDHSGCSDKQCLAMTTNPSTYKLSHRSDGCHCPLLYADQERMAAILGQGSIPLIAIELDSVSQAPKITVLEITQAQGFVAISHVWAEGAGNVHDNALQSCLLTYISELVKELPWDSQQGSFKFWIDTICVPVRPPELYTLALNQMRIPYERATHVLVLDSHLRSLNSSQLSPTETLAQVSCSSWMRRLWTLQEGRLAARVWFQFSDKAVDVKSVFDDLDLRHVPSRVELWLQKAIYAQLWVQIWYRGKGIRQTGAVASAIHSTRLALGSRSVSVATDEALCLSTLMDMDITRITSVSPTERMEVFWRTFRKVPLGFLFSRVSKKMPQTGLHWAPLSFLGLYSEKEWGGPNELSTPGEDDPHAIPTGSGLLVALPGFILHPDLISRMKVFDFTWNFPLLVQDEEGRWYSIRVEKPWRDSSDALEPFGELAVIVAQDLQEGAHSRLTLQAPNKFAFEDFSPGVLVSIVQKFDNLVYVTAHRHVVVTFLGPGVQTYLSTASRCAEDVNVSQPVLVKEHHTISKDRYRVTAENYVRDPKLMETLVGRARYFSENTDRESVIDDLLDTTVVAARFGDRCRAQKVAENQQWCVD
ncbi:MAG: hypothetical protein L6R40_007777 [Gallowayella cf. fulva]|nr:MAG: hypothetical protein L6R40_007777 [Xanthomendoza cf. fulva]